MENLDNSMLSPEYLFEVSWEICNKVGGINTVIATKALMLVQQLKDNYILIGPDLWRETNDNPVFEEDHNLFRGWRQKATKEGLRIKIGRWNIVGKPIVILVDFSTFISEKDAIFAKFWEQYRLDSISGGRDYIEAAIFGYAAGKVVESFSHYNLTIRTKIVAHFHEWMTGAGVLYLKQTAPQIATLFTTHATVMGRSLAGNGYELYEKLKTYSGDVKARELGLVAKQSLEKSTAQNTDAFTTVSEITARECEQFLERKIDVVTPNGFEDNFVPQSEEFEQKRQAAREKMIRVAEALLGYKISANSVLVANSGRYEFRNKGIDVFINAMGQLKNNSDLEKEVIAFVLVPANNYGPRKDLMQKLNQQTSEEVHNSESEDKILTHGLHDSEWDQILNEIKKAGLKNQEDDKVKIIYAPCYLDGNDGIFNLSYYDLLIGMDLTIFPSYYEPWGYTPLESLAFHIPTITTNLAGIGMWVNQELVNVNDGIEVFDRTVGIDQSLIEKINNRVLSCSKKSKYDQQRARENAYAISRIALWKNLIRYYHKAFDLALKKVEQRSDSFSQAVQTQDYVPKKIYKSNKPIWNRIQVQSHLPEHLQGLTEIAQNLWWSWNSEALELFEYMDNKLWEKSQHNPVVLLKEISYKRLRKLGKDMAFTSHYNDLYASFKEYLQKKEEQKPPRIAYFSMEYGLSNILKIYSGGLGILAGDYLKEASDSNVDMVGVGFFYRYGYFTQKVSLHGDQLVSYEPQDSTNLPISPILKENGEALTIDVALPGRIVHARIWKVQVGRVPLYLLDTDIASNSKEDRKISHQLYGGDNEHRLKQEMFLGIGGIRALDAMGVECDLFHCNEGHAALIGFERMRQLIMNKNFTFTESLEIVRASMLFTTHTPVPAGHDAFSEDLMMVYMGHYPARLKISWDEFMDLGRMRPGDKNEKFSMSYLAANFSQEINGVSMLHGDVTKHMFNKLWEGYYPEELHIGYVTNGVHAPTWTSKQVKNLYIKEFGEEVIHDLSNKEYWNKIYKVPDKDIWEVRQNQRKRLVDYIKHRIATNWIKRHEDPKRIVEVQNKVNKNALTLGFARRFATYKRAHLLFRNPDRLAKILNNPEKPVQIIFAGKAHPRDGGGQGLIKHIIEFSKRPEFLGKIIFLENYDIELASRMVQGVDVWINTPTRPLEASGTSGMKAVMNGVLNLSVLDGWWVEGYKKNAGWALPKEKTYENQEFQDELDAEMIYGLLENDIVPLFYKRDENNIPTGWVDYIKNCIANIAPDFTTKRMIDHYQERFYSKLYKQTVEVRKHNYAKAKRIASWKKRVARSWDSIEVVSIDFPDEKTELILGKQYNGKLVLDLNEIPDNAIGVEILLADTKPDLSLKISSIHEMELKKVENRKAYFEIEFTPSTPGVLYYGIRVFPKNDELPHRQDFSYLKWI